MINITEEGKRAFIDNNIKRWSFYVNSIEPFTITNENLIKESVKFSEPVCTTENITFGECEAAVLEFQYFGFESILEKEIVATVTALVGDKEFSIPMGKFYVVSCTKEYTNNSYKVKAYNRLRAEIVNQEAHNNFYDTTNTILVCDLLDEIGIEKNFDKTKVTTSGSNYTRAINTTQYTLKSNNTPFAIRSAPTSTQYTVEATISVYSATLDPTMYYKLSCDYDNYYSLEYKYFDKLTEYIEASLSTSTLVDTFMTKLFSAYTTSGYYGYSSFFGINLVTSSGTRERYSSVAAEYQSGLADGAIGDIFYKTLTGYSSIEFCFPCEIRFVSTDYTKKLTFCDGFTWTGDDGKSYSLDWKWPNGRPVPNWFNGYKLGIFNISSLSGFDIFDTMVVNTADLEGITAKEILKSSCELNCQLIKVDRATDKLKTITFTANTSYPSEELYPSETLFPSSAGSADLIASKKYYSQLYANKAKPYSKVVIYYKNTSGTETQISYPTGLGIGGTLEIKNNFLINYKNRDYSEMSEIITNIVNKLKAYVWTAIDLSCVGMPWVESGDKVEIATADGTLEAIILDRTLNGIMNMKDEYFNGEVE